MIKTSTKDELCQISLTGVRSITLLGLLIDAPRSLEEIRDAFLGYNLIDETSSDDIIRIDINTLRSFGCEISRASKKTNYKYELKKNPFAINITDSELSVIKRAYNSIKDSCSIETLIQYDNLFKKIAKFTYDENTKEYLLGISALKRENISTIIELIDDSKHKRTVKFVYKTPVSSKATEKEIVVTDVVCRNDKVYLYGFDTKIKDSVMLNIKRILSILGKNSGDDSVSIKPVTVKFTLKEFGIAGLTDEESIIEENDNCYTIIGNYHNKFIATQRILSFGSSCTVLSPDDFKNHIIETLKKMKEVY